MADPRQQRVGAGLAKAGLAGGALAAALAAASLIMPAEGERLNTYVDPVGIATTCYGHTGPDVKLGQHRSDDQCLDILATDIVKHQSGVARCVTRPLPVPVQAAMISFTFNAGEPKFCASTMARRLNAGDLRGACAELSKWVYAGKRKLPGLVIRRAKERAYCEKGL